MSRYRFEYEDEKNNYKAILFKRLTRLKQIHDLRLEEEANISLTDLQPALNPCLTNDLMEELGFEQGDWDTNGWEGDNWIYYHQEGWPTIIFYFEAWDFDMAIRLEDY